MYKINRKSDWGINISIQLSILITILGTAIFSLTNGTSEPLFPFSAELMLSTQLLAFIIALPVFRIPLYGPAIVGIIMWFFLFFLSMASALWGTNQTLILKRTLLIFVPAICLYLLVIRDKNPVDTFWKISKGLTYFGCFVSVIGILLYIFGSNVFTDYGRMQIIKIAGLQIQQSVVGIPPILRISSLSGNPNNLASWLMITLTLTTAQRIAGYISQSKLFFLGGLQATALLLTFSRAGIGTTIIIIALLYLLSARNKMEVIKRTILLILLLSVIFITLGHLTKVSPVLENRLTVGLNERGPAWILLYNAFLQKPLFGTGFGVSYEEILEEPGLTITSHNLFLAIISEIGLLGFLPFILIWLIGIYSAYLIVRKSFKTNNLFIENVVIGNTIIAILLGFIAHQVFEVKLLRYGFMTNLWVYLTGVALNPFLSGVRKNIENRISERVTYHRPCLWRS